MDIIITIVLYMMNYLTDMVILSLGVSFTLFMAILVGLLAYSIYDVLDIVSEKIVRKIKK